MCLCRKRLGSVVKCNSPPTAEAVEDICLFLWFPLTSQCTFRLNEKLTEVGRVRKNFTQVRVRSNRTINESSQSKKNK